MNISKMNRFELFLWIFVIIIASNYFLNYDNKTKIETKVSNDINKEAEIIRESQILEANKVAKLLIANATGEKKACLELPGIKHGYALVDGTQPYKKAEACHLGELPKVEGLWDIKERL